MKRLAFLAAVVVVSAAVAFAGEPKPLTYSGAKALLFDLGGLASLAAGNYGGGLGAKYYVASDLALRFSVGFSTSTETTDNPQSPLPAGDLAESELTNETFTIAPAITYTVARSSTVAAYVGGIVTYTWAKDKRTGNSGGLGLDFESGEEYRVSTSDWGLAGILGVEWWPWENISFSGEYRLGYHNATSETESSTAAASTTVDGPTTSGFGLGSANSAALTLSVYF